jgi:hypothetical protein
MRSCIPKTNHKLSVFYIKLNFITVFTHSQTLVHILSLLNPLNNLLPYLCNTHSKSLLSTYLYYITFSCLFLKILYAPANYSGHCVCCDTVYVPPKVIVIVKGTRR